MLLCKIDATVVNATNEKLRARAIRIVMQATGCEAEVAEYALDRAGNRAKLAILMLLTNTEVQEAEELLSQHNGFLRKAVDTQGG